MKLKRIVNTAVAVALTVSAVSAQESFNGIPASNLFVGSELFNEVMDTLLNADNFAGNGEIPGLSGGRGGPGNEGISPFYQGIGSGPG